MTDEFEERLEAMADGDHCDLSPNDRDAIRWALDGARDAERMHRWNKLGTVQKFLQCPDDVKAEFFRVALKNIEELRRYRQSALGAVAAERQRQITVEGWTQEHDDQYTGGDLASAGGCYALFADAYPNTGEPPPDWPWDARWWKPKNRRRDLVRAAALIIAEIELLDRANNEGPAP